jgi:hypothetical protein
LWAAFGRPVLLFHDVGLSEDAKDVDVWRLCQDRQWVLVTGNRNHDGPDSLEATIRRELTSHSLPVFTIGDPDAVMASRDYAVRVAVRLLEYLMDFENTLGAGRFFLP